MGETENYREYLKFLKRVRSQTFDANNNPAKFVYSPKTSASVSPTPKKRKASINVFAPDSIFIFNRTKSFVVQVPQLTDEMLKSLRKPPTLRPHAKEMSPRKTSFLNDKKPFEIFGSRGWVKHPDVSNVELSLQDWDYLRE